MLGHARKLHRLAKGMIKPLALQLLLMLVATYREALGLSRTYRLTTVRESLMTELKYAAAPEEAGEALLSKLFRERFAKDKVCSFLMLIAAVLNMADFRLSNTIAIGR